MVEEKKKRDTKTIKKAEARRDISLFKIVQIGLAYTVWVGLSLFASQIVMALIFRAVLSDAVISMPITQLIFSAITYVFCLVLVVFLPWKVLKIKTNRDELGLRGLPTWTDILLAPIGFIVFMIIAGLLMAIMQAILPQIDWEQAQDVGFNQLYGAEQMLQGFIALVVLAPIAEEVIFRGWLYGKLRARMSAVPAILLVSLLFGVMHGQWNVGVTVFVMSIAMCMIRELTGTIWSGILVHMIKNGLAFYLLYVVKMV